MYSIWLSFALVTQGLLARAPQSVLRYTSNTEFNDCANFRADPSYTKECMAGLELQTSSSAVRQR